MAPPNEFCAVVAVVVLPVKVEPLMVIVPELM